MFSPIFIYLEPLKHEHLSFPIEIYWSLSSINKPGGAGFLINPEEIDIWKGWDKDFFQKHGVSIDEIKMHGTSPSVICREIRKHLAGKVIYSGNVDNDCQLLHQLFAVTNEQEVDLTLCSLDDLILVEIISSGRNQEEANSNLCSLKSEARNRIHGIHGGVWEIRYFEELWKLFISFR